MTAKDQILKLYKTLIREAQKFPSYNFREYAVRKVRDSFKENKQLTDPKLLEVKIKEANKNLNIIQRQVIIDEMYKTDKLIIENITKE